MPAEYALAIDTLLVLRLSMLHQSSEPNLAANLAMVAVHLPDGRLVEAWVCPDSLARFMKQSANCPECTDDTARSGSTDPINSWLDSLAQTVCRLTGKAE
jgi:hypothetical protein